MLVRGARSYPPAPISQGETVDVRVVDGVIDAVGPDLDPAGCEVHDAEGLCVIPGLLDVHVHFRDPGLAHKEGWESGSIGALSGGVTAVCEVQNNPPLSTTRALLDERLAHVGERSWVDFGCYANLLPQSVPELAAMAERTPAFKIFLGCSTGLDGMDDPAVVRELFQAAAATGRMVVAHCEDEVLLRAAQAAHPDATAAQHHLVRPAEAELESVRSSIQIAEETGCELHVFHVSTAGAAEMCGAARARGLPIWSSTAPHYLFLSHEDAPRLGNLLRVNPSIKTRADSTGLIEALRTGAVDAIGTDHAPHPLDEKQRPYQRAPSGMPSVDLLWPLTWELVRRGLCDAQTALDSVTSRAAASLHLPRKGSLAPGFDGDLVLFDPAEERRVCGAELHSRSKWSAYEGLELAGFPRRVFVRGALAFRDGHPQEGEWTGSGRGLPLELPPPRR